MVAAVRQGASQRAVARRFGVSLDTVQRWVWRAADQRLDRVDWTDRSDRPHRSPRSTSLRVEEAVLAVRRALKEQSALGEYGAAAIRRELLLGTPGTGTRQALPVPGVPSVATIGRILSRRGAVDHRRRIRRHAPPPGWYLLDAAAGRVELDSFDVVEGLAIRGSTGGAAPARGSKPPVHLDVLTGVSLHGGLVAAWPVAAVSARQVVDALVAHWRAVGLPTYAQFDNDNRFAGPRQHADAIGRVIRLCLSLDVTPVFAPPSEHGFQAAIEGFNGRWQAKVWARFEHESLAALQRQSAKYVTASRHRAAVRVDSAPPRRPFPAEWRLDLQAPPRGHIVFLRRTNQRGAVSVLGHTFAVATTWPHRLVRCEVDLDGGTLRVYALRRREPTSQPLLCAHPYQLPRRHFKE